MKVFHLTSWLTPRGGGIPPVIEALARELIRRKVECRVAGLGDNSGSETILAGQPLVTSGRVLGPAAFGYSPELHAALSSLASGDTVLHVHGLWTYPGLLARRISRAAGARLLISPHGMLEPWALNNSRWKKKLAGWVFERRNLRTAECLHALCAAEAGNLRYYGLRNPIAVIPNGVDLAAFQNLPDRSVLEKRFPALAGRRWMLFLSRIHPKKGLVNLLKAWKQTIDSQPSTLNPWLLVIAGPDEVGHVAEVKRLCGELGIEFEDRSSQTEGGTSPSSISHLPSPQTPSVLFTGPLHGQEKRAALAGAELFVLPSFSEGFSMAVLEAAACGLPVLLTPPCNFPELVRAGGALEVSPEVAGCVAGLRQLLGLPDAERRAIGQRGKDLVAASYTWPRVAQEMLGVYRWLLEGGAPPACVRLD